MSSAQCGLFRFGLSVLNHVSWRTWARLFCIVDAVAAADKASKYVDLINENAFIAACCLVSGVNTLTPTQNGRYFADIFKSNCSIEKMDLVWKITEICS